MNFGRNYNSGGHFGSNFANENLLPNNMMPVDQNFIGQGYPFCQSFIGNYDYQNYPVSQSNNVIRVNQCVPKSEKRKLAPLEIFDPNNRTKLDLEKLAKTSNSKPKSDLMAEIKLVSTMDTLCDNKPNNGFKDISDMNEHTITENKIPNGQQNNDIMTASSSSQNDTDDSQSSVSKKCYQRDAIINIGSKANLSSFLSLLEKNSDCKDIIQKDPKYSLASLVNKYVASRKKVNIFESNILKRSSTGYLPPHLRLMETYSFNQNLDKFRRSFRIILNKIAPQNFSDCSNDIVKLIKETDKLESVSTNDMIDCLIEEIFDKAVKEEAYSVTYANLCLIFANMDEKEQLQWNFKASLLNRCKEMFHTPLQDQLDNVKIYWEKKIEEETDEKLKKWYISDIEEQVNKAKDKYFGNVRFIGELYMKDLLKPQIIYNCMKQLIEKHTVEASIVSLYKLLVTCGKRFDEQHPHKLNEIIAELKEHLNEYDKHKSGDSKIRISNKIRFCIMDTIELSERNWTLRTIQEQKIIQPKTRQELQKEDDLEKKIAQESANSVSNKQALRAQMKQSSSVNELRTKTFQAKKISIEPSSLCQTAPRTDTVQLKPSFQWTSGSGVKDDDWQSVERKSNRGYKTLNRKYKSTLRSQQQQLPLKNSAANVQSREESPNSSNVLNGNIGGSTNNAGLPRATGGKFAALLAQSDDALEDSESIYHIGGEPFNEFKSSMTNILTKENIDSNEKDVLKPDKIILTPDEMLDQIINNGTIDVNSWVQLSDKELFIVDCLDAMMEKDMKTRFSIGEQFNKMIEMNDLSFDILINGLRRFNENIDDLKADIPKIWIFLAEFFSRLLFTQMSDNLDITNLIYLFQKSFEVRIPDPDLTKCIIITLQYAATFVASEIENTNVLISSNLNETKTDVPHVFLNPLQSESVRVLTGLSEEDFLELMKQNKLDYLLLPSNLSKNMNLLSNYNLTELVKSLLPVDDEDLYSLLESKFTLEETQTENFVHFIFSCIFQLICSDANMDVEEFLDSKLLFCNRMVDHKPKFEKQVLLALKDNAKELSEKKVIHVVVTWIWTKQIVSEDAFHQWLRQTYDKQDGDEISSNEEMDDHNRLLITHQTIRSLLIDGKSD